LVNLLEAGRLLAFQNTQSRSHKLIESQFSLAVA
jgi:hypothetical protein